MSPLAFVFKVILSVVFIVTVNASTKFRGRQCEDKKKGIKSLTPEISVPGRYSLEICIDKGDYEFLYFHLRYSNNEQQQCNSQLENKTMKYHSVHVKNFEITTDCPVNCQNVTVDLIANGCYEIQAIPLNFQWQIDPNGSFTSYKYIGNSHDMKYFFEIKPEISILYNKHSSYLNIILNTGQVPINSFVLKVCLKSSYDEDILIYEQCLDIEHCKTTDIYTVECTNENFKGFNLEGSKILLFEHIDEPWYSWGEVFSGLGKVVFELDEEFDNAIYYVVNDKTGNYLSHNLIDLENTSVSPSRSGVVITCVVMVVLVLVGALVVRTLHVRGHLRRYIDPSFRFINPLSRQSEDDRSVIVQRLR